MNRLLLFLLSLFLSIGLISGCASTDDTQYNDFDSTVIIPLSVGENISCFELRITCADSRLTYTYGDATNEHLYAIEVVEIQEPERANNTLQMFFVSSGLEYADEIISVLDINRDNYNDIIVKTYQTPHSAAWYSAYRWIPEKGRFEAEPFFEYQCSGQPELMDKDMLVTSDVTLTNVEWKLYHLNEQGYYQPTRTMICERYDNISCAVIRSDTSQLLYSCEYSFDEELPTEEIMRLNSWFFFGDCFSFKNRIIDFVECSCVSCEIGKIYTGATYESIEFDSVITTGLSPTQDGRCRVNVICRTKQKESEVDNPQSNDFVHLSVYIDILTGSGNLTFSAVEEAVETHNDADSWVEMEHKQDGSLSLFVFDNEQYLIELSDWSGYVFPHVRLVDDEIIQLRTGAGTGVWISTYHNLSTGETSQTFDCSYYLDNGVIMKVENSSEIYLVSAFDENKYSHVVYLKFAPVANPIDCILGYELHDSKHLRLCFLDEDYEKSVVIIEIPEMCE